eukprot:CAMPEP_0172602250 /NCGR_PEP_ID=MMETSP1068-20121228/22428_1 /TAXON_ID=35684 /ORGANISM="Pseudopedinella elastica, Strain CCMP716" /LENGTH=218 /DNA_ID=CAMNT_0013403539 /DNA_START=97 /DNA_END=753 /DNA_ORIENTATION=-
MHLRALVVPYARLARVAAVPREIRQGLRPAAIDVEGSLPPSIGVPHLCRSIWSSSECTGHSHRELGRGEFPRRNFGRNSDPAKVSVPEHELDISFTKSSGPGGQNVNKVNTCVEVRFHVASASWVGDGEARGRLAEAERGRVNKRGELVLTCQEHRTQSQNRAACLKKLAELVAAARIEPIERSAYEGISTRGKARRRDDKRNRSQVKQNRRVKKGDW